MYDPHALKMKRMPDLSKEEVKAVFGEHVLGPSSPAVSRVRNQYIKNVMLKIPPEQSLIKTKNQIYKIKNTFQAVADFRPIRFIIDVDCQ